MMPGRERLNAALEDRHADFQYAERLGQAPALLQAHLGVPPEAKWANSSVPARRARLHRLALHSHCTRFTRRRAPVSHGEGSVS